MSTSLSAAPAEPDGASTPAAAKKQAESKKRTADTSQPFTAAATTLNQRRSSTTPTAPPHGASPAPKRKKNDVGVGSTIEVFWPAEDGIFSGVVHDVAADGALLVHYDDGDKGWARRMPAGRFEQIDSGVQFSPTPSFVLTGGCVCRGRAVRRCTASRCSTAQILCSCLWAARLPAQPPARPTGDPSGDPSALPPAGPQTVGRLMVCTLHA